MSQSIVLSVSLGTGYYRHIQLGVENTLEDLSTAILKSFQFDNDHLHSFFMNNRAWDSSMEYVCSLCDLSMARGYSSEAKLSRFRLKKGAKFLYLFDYGDEWRFTIKVLRYTEEQTDMPIVLRSVGEVSQYGDDDDDDDYFGYYEDDEDGYDD
ncbi:MAG: plasmid pRiA4b ORF-3 family protein [Eubacteriaceae bacterium]|nr:plasmid pRiA4b ORF-3 family protein [Eubacteriaceae bacterium]